MADRPTPPAKSWDDYWDDAAAHRGFYAHVARFYRRHIISPALKHYFRKYLRDQPGLVYLHAGCGSAESDHRIDFEHATFVLLDSSFGALQLARKLSKLRNVHLVCGDIYHPPFRDGTVAGIWNLGVMEHFEEADLVRIFDAFRRILRDDGRLLLFWPPTYGLTVVGTGLFLSVVNRFRRTPIVLYPDEVSRFSSRRWLDPLARRAGLTIQRVHFGVRDLFTYAILIGGKS